MPFVLVYIAKKLDYFIGRRFVKLPYVGLANIIFDFEGMKQFHTELLQENVTSKNIKLELEKIDPKEFFDNSIALRKLLSKKSSNLINLING